MGRNKFSIRKDYSKIFEKNNLTIAFNVLYAKKEEKYILLIFQNLTYKLFYQK